MSNYPPAADSSSSDEDDASFRPNVRIPNVNLNDIRRQQAQRSKPNLSKAGKKLTGKSVRFPDMRTPRDTIISNNSSTTNNSSEDEEAGEGEHRSVLPSFQFKPKDIHTPLGSDENNEDSDFDNDSIPDFSHILDQPQSMQYSSDEDEDVQPKASKKSKASAVDGIDITDQSARKSISSSKSGESEDKKPGRLRGILRKMSLADNSYAGYIGEDSQPSASDTFIGRMLSMSGGQLGLSGGGLAPGASRTSGERELDEEERVGTGDGEQIEMKKLNFDELNDEAKNLIYNHVPHAAQMSTIREGSSSEMSTKGSTDNPEADLLNHKEYDSDSSSSPTSKPHKKGHNSHQSSLSFYAPNPDLTLRRDDQPEYDNQDDFLLDENEDSYVPPPKQVHAGVLSSLLKLYQNPQASKSASSFGTSRSFGGSTYGSRVPTLAEENEYDESLNLAGSKSTSTVDFSKFKDSLKNAPSHFSSKAYKATHKLGGKKNRERVQDSSDEDQGMYDEKDSDGVRLPSFQNARPKQPKRQAPVPKVSDFKKLANHKKEQQLRITVHIADILQRQRFIMRMCRALMLFGAPTHRLEEYMIMTSRVLEIDGQFIYFPGCMIVSFGDASTRTSEVHLVKCAQGLNLSKLSDTHKIYKGVIHDLIGVEDASKRIEDLLKKKNLYPPWLCVLIYGLGSAAVCPFAFGGGWVDIPISFGVGCCVGYLQFYLASMSNLYSSVFEVTASIVVSFISRGIGSIKGGRIFCFAAIAQGSLALILPGYIILCGSLELQSRNLVAGSVRMFYAIIYSLFLGFGITLGAALYGWVDKKSVSANSCDAGHSLDDKWKILFVPMFSISLALINQSRWQQLPVMLIISGIGYIGNYFAGKHFSQVTEFTACIGAFIIGVLGNLYSRIWKGMAVSAMLPAIFVQVPSGIASKSSLISGIQTADQITKGNSTTSANTANGVFDASSLSFGATMVEVSIGISVGLFAAALVVYPFGKKKTGLFTL